MENIEQWLTGPENLKHCIDYLWARIHWLQRNRAAVASFGKDGLEPSKDGEPSLEGVRNRAVHGNQRLCF